MPRTSPVHTSRWKQATTATLQRYVELARDLRSRFNQDFWLDDQGTYALALDADKKPVEAVASNVGHCLWTGIIEPEKAARVADRLMSDEMFSGWGVRTLSRSMSAFNPVGYHTGSVWPHDNSICAAGLARYGFVEHAQRIILAQLDVAEAHDGRLPELFAGFDRTRSPRAGGVSDVMLTPGLGRRVAPPVAPYPAPTRPLGVAPTTAGGTRVAGSHHAAGRHGHQHRREPTRYPCRR